MADTLPDQKPPAIQCPPRSARQIVKAAIEFVLRRGIAETELTVLLLNIPVLVDLLLEEMGRLGMSYKREPRWASVSLGEEMAEGETIFHCLDELRARGVLLPPIEVEE